MHSRVPAWRRFFRDATEPLNLTDLSGISMPFGTRTRRLSHADRRQLARRTDHSSRGVTARISQFRARPKSEHLS